MSEKCRNCVSSSAAARSIGFLVNGKDYYAEGLGDGFEEFRDLRGHLFLNLKRGEFGIANW